MTERTPLTFRQQGEGWHLAPRRHRWIRVGIGVVAALALVAGVGGLVAGEGLSGVLPVVLGLALGWAAWGLFRRPTPVPPQHLAAQPGPGLLLPQRGGGLGAILGFALTGLLVLTGGLAGGVARLADGDLAGLVPLAGGTALGLLLLAGAWGTLRQRRTPDRGILLTPDAVVLRTRKDPEVVPWSALVRVRDHWARAVRIGPPLPDDLVRNWLTFETADPDGDVMALLSGTPHASVPVETLATDPGLTLRVCRHYLEHPEERAELAAPGTAASWA